MWILIKLLRDLNLKTCDILATGFAFIIQERIPTQKTRDTNKDLVTLYFRILVVYMPMFINDHGCRYVLGLNAQYVNYCAAWEQNYSYR